MIVTLLAALTAAPAVAVDYKRFFACVRAIEGHRWEDPGGALAIQPGTWRQHSRLPYRFASVPEHAEYVGGLHLAWLSKSLKADGIEPSAYSLAGCWRYGLEGFKARAKTGSLDYAIRFWHLYHSEYVPAAEQ